MFWVVIGIFVFIATFITGVVETSNDDVAVGIILIIFSIIAIIILTSVLIINASTSKKQSGNIEYDKDFQSLERFDRGNFFLCTHNLDKALDQYNLGKLTDPRCKEMIIMYLMEVSYNIQHRTTK